ncbi:MAG: DUF559 domain-containing protein [Candidatus Aminicenantes bacterium]|nr:DUF559 domain-containing protein [Candidatus Aminicenantes bacterium]
MRSNRQLFYDVKLKVHSRKLRKDMTDGERRLWSKIRRKQLHGLQFYRQRIIGEFIVDFYCPKAKLIIELDGGQHFALEAAGKDEVRDAYFNKLGLSVLRFNNAEIFINIDGVVENILEHL